MAEKISKTQRWLDLIAFLVGRKVPVEFEQVMEAVPAYAAKYLEGDARERETVRRMFERDKDELRELGIPVETVPLTLAYGAETVQAYRMASRDFYLPYLRLLSESGPEAAGAPADAAGPGAEPSPLQKARVGIVEMPLRDAGVAWESLDRMQASSWFPYRPEAASALRKLSFDLRGFEPRPSVLYVDRPEAAEIRDRIRVLSEALHARKRVSFTYHGIRRGHATEREVAPYGLLFQKGHWYLVGHDASRDDVRVFRVGRMDEPRPNTKAPKTPDYDIPEGFTLDAYRDRDAWELGGDEEPAIETRVRFEFPTSLWAERNAYGTLVEELTDGSSVRSFEVRQLNPFVRWILSLEGKARVVDPPAVASEVGKLAREVLAVYEAGGGSDAESGSDAGESPGGADA